MGFLPLNGPWSELGVELRFVTKEKKVQREILGKKFSENFLKFFFDFGPFLARFWVPNVRFGGSNPATGTFGGGAVFWTTKWTLE